MAAKIFRQGVRRELCGVALKLLCVLFSVLTVLLCGCTGRAETGDAAALDFQADFSAEYRGMSLAGSVSNIRQGVCTLTFTYPETLEGLQISSKGGGLIMRRGDAAATADEGYLPENSFPSLFFALLREAARQEPSEITLPSGRAALVTDEKGLPAKAEIPSEDTEITFSGSKKTDQQ